MPLVWTSDRLAAYLTKRNNGIREAEMRLGVLIPAMVIAPCGLIVYGLTAQHDLQWVGYFAGVAIFSALVGQHVVGKVIRILGRASLIIFILSSMIFISAITLGIYPSSIYGHICVYKSVCIYMYTYIK